MGSDSQQEHGRNTGGLSLDLLIGFTTNSNKKDPNQKPSVLSCLKFDHVLPALSLGPVDRAALSTSPGSSSNNSTCEKKRSLDQGKEFVGSSYGEEVEVDEDEEASPRKKLRLTKEQSAVLEDSFKQHTTLNPNQKEALAKRLNLRPRQVEVWFQNRRARTKLKQTEMDCELLKKFYEKLTEENKRLHKELQELKTLKLAAPAVYMQMPAATLSMCPSCERFITPSPADGGGGSGVAVFSGMNGTKPPQIFTTHPSAAC